MIKKSIKYYLVGVFLLSLAFQLNAQNNYVLKYSVKDYPKFKSKNMNSSHISIVYNGEIYNYLELREELKRRGNTFSTNTHSEVILASHLEYGPNCVKRFNGMWAFCIYDEVKGILFFSRR